MVPKYGHEFEITPFIMNVNVNTEYHEWTEFQSINNNRFALSLNKISTATVPKARIEWVIGNHLISYKLQVKLLFSFFEIDRIG